MSGSNYYLLSALPGLGPLGSRPAVSLPAFWDELNDRPALQAQVAVPILADELLCQESLRVGAEIECDPIVSTLEPWQGIVEFIRTGDPTDGATRFVNDEQVLPVLDMLWRRYFEFARKEGLRLGSPFLLKWVEFEVALREAFVLARGSDAPGRGATISFDLGTVVAAWREAHNPLMAAQIVERFRYGWISEHEAWFSFGDEEIVAYALKLIIQWRWLRLLGAGISAVSNDSPNTHTGLGA